MVEVDQMLTSRGIAATNLDLFDDIRIQALRR